MNPPPEFDAPRPSLIKDLFNGNAGWGVRIVVVIALAVLYLGAGFLVAFFLAAVVPAWNRSYYAWTGPGGARIARRAVYPSDVLMTIVLLMAAAGWLATSAIILFRHSSKRAVMYPIFVTIGIIALTVALGIAADDAFVGDQEIVVAGIILVGIAATILVWVQAIRGMSSRRPLANKQDQLPDVRCPDCGYRMVGLYDTRCPECGRAYTVDELLARQFFARPAGGAIPPAGAYGPPAPPVASGGPGVGASL